MKAQLPDLTDEQIAAVFEKLRAENAATTDIAALKKEVALLTETVTILAHDLNDRLARRKKCPAPPTNTGSKLQQ